MLLLPFAFLLVVFVEVNLADYYCNIQSTFANSGIDSASYIQNCIDNTASGDVLTLPVGVYTLDTGLIISQPIKIVSELNEVPCSISDPNSCPILRASANYYSSVAMLYTKSDINNVWIDHIGIDGNRDNRLSSQSAYECSNDINNRNCGRNFYFEVCTQCSVTNSVLANALCASGFVFTGDYLHFENNTVQNNGDHNEHLMWADGLTCLTCDHAYIVGNSFIGNSDVDLIMGSGVNSHVHSNLFLHAADNNRPVFSALMCDNFNGGTTGDFAFHAEFVGVHTIDDDPVRRGQGVFGGDAVLHGPGLAHGGALGHRCALGH